MSPVNLTWHEPCNRVQHSPVIPMRAQSRRVSIQRVRSVSASILTLTCALTGCTTTLSSAADSQRIERSKVTQLIARYETGSPTVTTTGRPWGAQCVSSTYRDNLHQGRGLGAGMRTVQIVPPVTPTVARAIALQFQQCPYIEWAEADAVRFTIP